MTRVVVPPSAGLFSSFGLLYADIEHHYSRTMRRLLRQTDLGEIDRAWNALSDQAQRQLATEGFSGDRVRLSRSAALHYKGQSYELVVPVPDGPVDAKMARYLEEAFGQEHERTYGHRAGPDEPVELVSIQVVGSGVRKRTDVSVAAASSGSQPAPTHPPRRAYFGDEHGWLATPVARRSDLKAARSGPLIVEEYDATCVVPPGWRIEADASGNMVIDLI
jgi:N-methylhydantoinase A